MSNVPWGADNDPSAPWFQEPDPRPFECDCCYKQLNEGEQDDPIIIEGRTLCDRCAENLTLLRMDGVLASVAGRTKTLKQAALNVIIDKS